MNDFEADYIKLASKYLQEKLLIVKSSKNLKKVQQKERKKALFLKKIFNL